MHNKLKKNNQQTAKKLPKQLMQDSLVASIQCLLTAELDAINWIPRKSIC